jgi:hypothetical protein
MPTSKKDAALPKIANKQNEAIDKCAYTGIAVPVYWLANFRLFLHFTFLLPCFLLRETEHKD